MSSWLAETTVTHERMGGVAQRFALEAARLPDHTAIIAADLRLTYRQLWKITCGFAVSMQRAGVDQSALIAVDTRDMVASIAALLAASLLGSAYVAVDDSVLSDGVVRPTHVFRSPEVAPRRALPVHLMDATWPRAAESSARYDVSDYPVADMAETFWYAHTSGTSGRPKYMSLTHRQFLARALAMAEDFEEPGRVFCSLFPCNSRVFLVRAIAALLSGSTIVDTVDVGLMRQAGVNIVLGSPRTLVDWLGGRTLSPQLDVVQVTGAKLPAGDMATLLGSFLRLEDVYGASETSKAFKNIYTRGPNGVEVRGKRLDSEIEIEPGAQGEATGLVRVRNPYMATHYLDDPSASHEVFRDGWFYSGDIGSWGPNGVLRIEGRRDELVNLGGAKVNPLDIERLICGVSGVTGAFVGLDPSGVHPPGLAALISVSERAAGPGLARLVLDTCAAALPAHAVPRMVLAVGALPRTEDGENRRRDCEAVLKQVLGTVGQTEKGTSP